MKHKALYVEWEDSCSVGSRVWVSAEDVRDSRPSKCVSIGLVVKETNDFITLAGHWAGEESGDYSGNLTIPRSAVRMVRRIAIPARKRREAR